MENGGTLILIRELGSSPTDVPINNRLIAVAGNVLAKPIKLIIK